MSTILRHSDVVDIEIYERDFLRKDGGGFSFPCDNDGRPEPPANPAAAENLRKCLAGEFPGLEDKGVRHWTHRQRIPMLIRCDCNRELELTDCMTNRCECGTFYNGSGQRLAHPSQWGEETGERFADDGSQIL